jgi:hypothetical protein
MGGFHCGQLQNLFIEQGNPLLLLQWSNCLLRMCEQVVLWLFGTIQDKKKRRKRRKKTSEVTGSSSMYNINTGVSVIYKSKLDSV